MKEINKKKENKKSHYVVLGGYEYYGFTQNICTLYGIKANSKFEAIKYYFDHKKENNVVLKVFNLGDRSPDELLPENFVKSTDPLIKEVVNYSNINSDKYSIPIIYREEFNTYLKYRARLSD